MNKASHIKLTEVNHHLLCVLCGGYFIDATTIIECLHSFCRSCIVKYLESSKQCPICDVQVHKTKPTVNIRSDQKLQDLVYKIVPNLFRNEMKRRREFYAKHPSAAPRASSLNSGEERGEVEDRHTMNVDEEKISLCLQHTRFLPPYRNENVFGAQTSEENHNGDRRYLLCPSELMVRHLKKFLRVKFGLPPHFQIEVFHSDEPLQEDYTLLDVACIYGWRRQTPLKLFYIVYDKTKTTLKMMNPVTNEQALCSRPPPVRKKKADKSIAKKTVKKKKALEENEQSKEDEVPNVKVKKDTRGIKKSKKKDSNVHEELSKDTNNKSQCEVSYAESGSAASGNTRPKSSAEEVRNELDPPSSASTISSADTSQVGGKSDMESSASTSNGELISNGIVSDTEEFGRPKPANKMKDVDGKLGASQPKIASADCSPQENGRHEDSVSCSSTADKTSDICRTGDSIQVNGHKPHETGGQLPSHVDNGGIASPRGNKAVSHIENLVNTMKKCKQTHESQNGGDSSPESLKDSSEEGVTTDCQNGSVTSAHKSRKRKQAQPLKHERHKNGGDPSFCPGKVPKIESMDEIVMNGCGDTAVVYTNGSHEGVLRNHTDDVPKEAATAPQPVNASVCNNTNLEVAHSKVRNRGDRDSRLLKS